MMTHELLSRTFRIMSLIYIFCFTLIVINVYLVVVNINFQVSLDILYGSGNTSIHVRNSTDYCQNIVQCSKILRSLRVSEFATVTTKLYITPNTYNEISHYAHGTLYISLGICVLLILCVCISFFVMCKAESKL